MTARVTLDTSKYAIVYPRQSSPEQVENNIYSLERQMLLVGRAREDGFPEDHVLLVNDDLGMSGGRITTRPGFTRALKLLDQGVVAVIYVEDLTRLSRDERTIDQMVIADACERAGALIYMGGSWYDMRDDGQRMSYKYQAIGFSESWRQHIRKLQEARARKASQGRVVTQLPRGLRPNRTGSKRDPEHDKPIIHEPEAALIRALVERLPEAGGIRELFRQVDPMYWPDGSRLSITHLKKLLTHPMLRGHFVFGEIVVPNNHPAIITPKQADMIDNLRENNRSTRRRKGTAPEGVLSSLVWCASCQEKMYTDSGGHSPAYRCMHGKQGVYHFGTSLPKLDALVMADFWERVADVIGSIVARIEVQRQAVASDEDHNDQQRKTIQRRIDGFMRSLADPDLPAVARKMIQGQLDDAGRQLEQAASIAPRAVQLDADMLFFDDLVSNPDQLALVHMAWDETPLVLRRPWVKRFIERVEVDQRGAMVVRYRGGLTAHLVHARGSYLPEEMAIIRAIYLDPDRPKRGWNQQVRQALADKGYIRTTTGIYHAVETIRKSL